MKNSIIKKRYEELDSLRGLAALSVLFFHYLSVINIFSPSVLHSSYGLLIDFIIYSPLHIFWAGSEAVIFFFVLSGFVLSLKFYTKNSVSYRAFLATRFCRIYLPSYVATLIAITLDATLSRHGIPGLSDWFNSIWKEPVTRGLVENYLLLIRYFGYGQYNPVMWTLVMEVRISLLFPLLMVLIKHTNWKVSLLIGYSLSLFYYAISNNGTRADIFSIQTDYVSILSFIVFFIIGALLAKHRKEILSRINRLSIYQKTILLIVAMFLYTISFWTIPFIGNTLPPFIADVSVSGGVALFITLALATRISTILKHKVIHFIGKISYSIYLYHAIILLALIYLLYPTVPIYIIWIVGIIITILISTLSYMYVEQPAIRLGSRISKIIDKK